VWAKIAVTAEKTKLASWISAEEIFYYQSSEIQENKWAS